MAIHHQFVKSGLQSNCYSYNYLSTVIVIIKSQC